MRTLNHQGLILSLKRQISERTYRKISLPFIWLCGLLPAGFHYSLGKSFRARRYPYMAVDDGDVVVQIGAPRDLLKIGRSRSIYFMQMVGSGTVVVMEPDPESAAAMDTFVARYGYGDTAKIIMHGAWSEDAELTFLSSPLHPASNLIEGVENIEDRDIDRRRYEKITISVRSVDDVLHDLDLPMPKLVSITANGAESKILEGMKKTIAAGLPYISLAITGENYPEMMRELGYELIAKDDRGFTFVRSGLS